MLQLLLHIILISFICMAWGVPAFLLLRVTEKGRGKFIMLFFWGLLTLAFLSSWMILFVPLRFNYLLIATALLLLVLFFVAGNNASLKQLLSFNKNNNNNRVLLSFALSCILLFLLLGTLKPSNFDTDIYHLQVVRWSQEYGVVPGIANLYPRLGLGSNWFNLISLFHIPAFPHQNFTFLNTTVTTWFLCWLLHKWATHAKGNGSTRLHKAFGAYYLLVILYCLFDWQLFRDAANSTSYDFIVTALTLMALSWLAENIFIHKNTAFSLAFTLLTLSIIPFKLSGAFILAPLFIYLLQHKNAKAWLQTALAGIMIVTPLLIKNYITSGYPLFPSSFSIDSPDWQLPPAMTNNLNDYIMSGNKFYNYPTSFMHEQEITAFNWIPFWIKTVLLKHKILLLLTSLSLLILFYNPVKEIKHDKIRLLFAGVWLMMIAWFFTAPDPRFAFSIILFLAFFPLCLLLGHLINSRLYGIVLAAAIIPVLGYAVIKIKDRNDWKELLVHPVDTTTPGFSLESRNQIPFINTRINKEWMCPCFYAPLPCMGEDNPFVVPRTGKISDGFYMNPKPDSSFINGYNY